MADLTERLGPSLYFPRVIEIVIPDGQGFQDNLIADRDPVKSRLHAPRQINTPLTPRCNHQFADNLKATITFV